MDKREFGGRCASVEPMLSSRESSKLLGYFSLKPMEEENKYDIETKL
jgi:hypothetical protein